MSCDPLRHYRATAETCEGPCWFGEDNVPQSDDELRMARMHLMRGAESFGPAAVPVLGRSVAVVEVVVGGDVYMVTTDSLTAEDIPAAWDSLAAQAAAHWRALAALSVAWRCVTARGEALGVTHAEHARQVVEQRRQALATVGNEVDG